MKRFLVPIVAVALGAPFAAAHDFWLVPVGAAIEARTGSRFPVSTNAVAPSRLAEAVAVSAAGREALAVVGIRDSALVLRADPAIGGTFWVAVALHPRRIDLTAEQFNDYLLEDGLPQIHALRQARGELERPSVERYQKWAKALLRRPGPGSAGLQAVGHRFEIVPLADPGALEPGDTLPVEVRFEGRAMPQLTVNAGWDGQADSTHAVTTVTDAAGRARVVVTRAGLWYVRTIHMREAHDRPFQWESFWASLTLTVR